MIRTAAILYLLTVIVPLAAMAQARAEVRRSQTSGVEFYTTNYGSFGHRVLSGDHGFFYPRGGTISYLFGSGVWFGARKNVDGIPRTLSVITYNTHSGKSWMRPGEWTASNDTSGPFYDQLAYSPEFDSTNGRYIGSDNRPAWPLWRPSGGGPDFSNPGIYVTDTAGRTQERMGSPAFMPDVAEQFTSRYHDGDISRYEGAGGSVGFPIGLQIEQNIYGFATDELRGIVILHYRLINVSGDTLRDCHVGELFDTDLGLVWNNDEAGYYNARPDMRTGYVWSRPEAANPGTLVISMLESPAVDLASGSPSFGFVRHDKPRYETTEQIPLSTFRILTYDDLPTTVVERYDVMASRARDSSRDSADLVILLATGPFHLAPGDTARLAIGLSVLAHYRVESDGVHLPVEQAAERMIALYHTPPRPAAVDSDNRTTGLSIRQVYPNPAAASASIDLDLPQRSEVRLQLVDALGRIVLQRASVMEGGQHRLSLELDGVAPGIYMIGIGAAGERESRRIMVSR